MISSDFRAEARRRLTGKWGKVALITLAYFVVFFVWGFIQGFIGGIFNLSEDSLILTVLNLVVEIPLSFGIIIAFFKVFNSEEVKPFDFFSFGFNNFKKSWGITFNMILKVIVPFILLIVSIVILGAGSAATIISSIGGSSNAMAASTGLLFFGLILYIVSIVWFIVKSYYYQLAYVIAADEPELTSKEAVNKSKELMTGKRGKLFCLQLSFIGWAILAVFTFGIGMLWLMPYMQFAIFAFYNFVAKKDSQTVVSE